MAAVLLRSGMVDQLQRPGCVPRLLAVHSAALRLFVSRLRLMSNAPDLLDLWDCSVRRHAVPDKLQHDGCYRATAPGRLWRVRVREHASTLDGTTCCGVCPVISSCVHPGSSPKIYCPCMNSTPIWAAPGDAGLAQCTALATSRVNGSLCVRECPPGHRVDNILPDNSATLCSYYNQSASMNISVRLVESKCQRQLLCAVPLFVCQLFV